MINSLRSDSGFSVHELCDTLKVSRSGFYSHLQKHLLPRRQEDAALCEEICHAFNNSRQT